MSELKNQTNSKILLFSLLCIISFGVLGQTPSDEYSILFYNTENLFDTADDIKTMDEEFTPEGTRHWTSNRLTKKINDISKVILIASGWNPPQLIALCEVENKYVLEKLINETPLQSIPYKIIHKESPDSRGIDVALLFNVKEFFPIEYQYIPLKSNENVIKTREILYVSGILNQTDTIHLFINHWPSRYSGLLESQPMRNLAAQTLRKHVDLLQSKYVEPKIIIIGDFNDQPTDESISIHLGASKISNVPDALHLYNLSYPWIENELGTIKYQSQWFVFDQVVISGSLLNKGTVDKLYTHPEWAKIVQFPFLLAKDERYGGLKINRTYNGFQYNGGFSDHLPVLLKLKVNH